MDQSTRAESRREDRRQRHPLLADWRVAIRGRRRQVRRASDDGHVQVDHIKPELVLVIITIMLLSALDAHFTLSMTKAGVVLEANPFMKFFLDLDAQLFINIKTALTASSLIVLAVCADLRVFGRQRVESILYVVMAGYGALITYHLSLAVRSGLV